MPSSLQRRTSRSPSSLSPGSDVGRGRKPEGHALAEDRRAAPDRAERAQAGAVKHVERVEIAVDRLGAFEMHDCGHVPLVETGTNGGGVGADPEQAARLQPEEQRRFGQNRVERGGALDGLRQGQGVVRSLHLAVTVGLGLPGADPDREEAASEAARLRLRQIELPRAIGREVAVGVRQQAGQRVVVTIEYRRSCFCHRTGAWAGRRAGANRKMIFALTDRRTALPRARRAAGRWSDDIDGREARWRFPPCRRGGVRRCPGAAAGRDRDARRRSPESSQGPRRCA